VAEDSISQGHSILQGRTKIAVEPDIYEYALPSDFISVLELYQYHDTTFYRVDQHPLSGLRNHFTPGSTAAIYTHFDVYGVTSEILGEGVVTTGNSNTVFTDDKASFSASGPTGISVSEDMIYNLTDDSVGTITGLTSTTLTASSGLSGGKTNMWQQGDRYQAQRGNETLQVLNMYPPVSAGDTENIVSETDATAVSANFGTFSLTDEAVLYSVQAYIASTVTGPVTVEVQDNSGTVITRAAFDSASTSAYNEAVFEYSYRLAKSTTYRVELSDGAGANIPFLSTAAFTKFKVNGYTGNEYLDLYYARYPRPYSTTFTGSCEIPEWGIEAVILYAEYMALLKINGGRNNMATQALNDYKGEIANILRQRGLRSRNRVTVVGDVIGGSSRIPTIKNVPITTKLPLG
tara:strand:+ start:1738 stop:2952 length:1215 start_codon:yes stop_codon:yes gene_type:complete